MIDLIFGTYLGYNGYVSIDYPDRFWVEILRHQLCVELGHCGTQLRRLDDHAITRSYGG